MSASSSRVKPANLPSPHASLITDGSPDGVVAAFATLGRIVALAHRTPLAVAVSALALGTASRIRRRPS